MKHDSEIRTAIEQRRLLSFLYKGKPRIVEPHDYGIHKGVVKLFGFQIGGRSSAPLPNWRWAETELVSGLRILDDTFAGGRPTASGKHQKWDELYARVRPAATTAGSY